jgi:formamidopyrimidine-DNA glycosylase
MPELPDITVYIESLDRLLAGRTIERIRIVNPFLLRSVDPPVSAAEKKKVEGFRRIGKRIVFELEGDLFLVLHLMISGRLQWKARGAPVTRKVGHFGFDFENGTLILTEASSKKRASLHVVAGESRLASFDPGGIEVLDASLQTFAEALRRENHTIKRTMTDPKILSGIGNAYSDEILHRARMSPLKLTKKLDDEEIGRLFDATRSVLVEWTDRIREETGQGFPTKVTAFRAGMAVHGRFGEPCPVCGTAVQRIAYAENEANYCPRCQTGGKLLADRSLSRLMKQDWPKTIDELEENRERNRL